MSKDISRSCSICEENDRSIRYLTKQDIAGIYADLSAQVMRDSDEPLPEFRYAKEHEIDALIAVSQQRWPVLEKIRVSGHDGRGACTADGGA